MKKDTSSTNQPNSIVFSREDFLHLLSKDKESAYHYYIVNITPYAHKLTVKKIANSKRRGEKIKYIMSAAWEKIEDLKTSNSKTVFGWFKKFTEKELKKGL